MKIKNTFNHFLEDKHASNYPWLDDDMPDQFEEWKQNLDGDCYRDYLVEWIDNMTQDQQKEYISWLI